LISKIDRKKLSVVFSIGFNYIQLKPLEKLLQAVALDLSVIQLMIELNTS